MPYKCPQCKLWNDTIKCWGCSHFLVSDTKIIDDFLPAPPLPERIGCAVVVAHWGDVYAALAHTKQVLDLIGQSHCDVVYWGPDPNIAEWVRCQPWVKRVFCVPDGEGYSHFVNTHMNRIRKADMWRGQLPSIAGLDPDDLWIDCIPSWWHCHQYSVAPWKCPALPAKRVKWAKDFLYKTCGKDTGDVVLLHPSSTWSNKPQELYQHWLRAIDWLLENTSYRYLLTGLNTVDIEHPRLINVVGQMPSNMENLALVTLLDRAVTTCNSVSLFTMAYDVPAIVGGNKMTSISHANPYRRLIDRGSNVFVPFDSDFERFVEAAQKVLSL